MADGLRRILFCVLLLCSMQAGAAAYELPRDIGVNGTPFKDCSGAGPTYTCTRKIDIKGGDSVVLTANVTLNVSNEFKVSSGASVDNGGFVFNVDATQIHIDGPGTVLMDNLTASGDIIIHQQANLTANVTSTGGNIDIEDGGATVNGNIDAQNGAVSIIDGNNTINGNVSANGGAGPLNIDNTSIVSGTCNPDHPQCNGGPVAPPGGGPVCTTTQIAADGEEFRAISGSADDNVIAAGKNGSLYHYDGATWTKNAFVSPETLNDIEVVAANLAYAVGKKGTVLQYDGSNWTTLPAPSGDELMGVWADASGVIWVVGKNDALYRWDGASWQDMSVGAQANVDNKAELRDAWGDGSVFYALEKDGDLYRYDRVLMTWSKRTACSADPNLDLDVRDVWGDGSGNIYIAGKDKDPNPDDAAILLYDAGTNTCSKVFSTSTENGLEGIYGDNGTIYAVGKKGLVVDNTSGTFSESIVGGDDYKDVWMSNSGTAYYAGKNGQLTTCGLAAALDHFVITPATLAASTCLPNAITITAEDAGNNTLASYGGTVTITTSTNHGNWSKNALDVADGVLSPNPDSDDNGAVQFTFDPLDMGVIVLDLSDTHAETLTITVADSAVSTLSAGINFGDNVFVVSEDPVQVAGRPLSMNIALWTNDRGAGNCFVDSNYDYSPHSLDVSIDRNGVLPAANNPRIGGTPIVDGATAAIDFDFQTLPGQASFLLDNSDVGQFRLLVSDNTLLHGDGVIFGMSGVITLRPFGIAVNNLRDTLSGTPNPGATAPGAAIFTTAGYELSATVSGVLWDAADDSNNDGVLDSGVYADNTDAPSFAWDTDLSVSLAPASYTPSPGTPGTLNNNSIAQADFSGGAAPITDLRYTEVGSFTLQAAALDYLGEATADIGGDDVIVGRFVPAAFEVTVADNGVLGDACGVFTYVGQDFGYATAPAVSVTAVNAIGDPTQQYRDAFVKLDGSSITVVAGRDETTQGTDMVLLDVSYAAAPMAFAAQNNGSVNYTFGNDSYRYGPAAPVNFSKNANSRVAPFTADIDPEITAITDGEVTSSYAAGTYLLDPAGNDQRFGRLRMDNVHGSELNPLLMPVFTEFWNGFSFQKNSLDTCTTIASANLVSVASPPGLSVPAVVNAPASAGDILYSYPAPGAGNDGYVDTTTDLSAASHLWLRFDGDADGEFDDDPSARATFGIFEGNPVQIYIEQVYQ